MDRFDFAIIGAGPAGEAAAYKARELGASVAIIDRRWFGGSCPHIGCLPSKSLLDGAARHHANPATYDWPEGVRCARLHGQPAGRRGRARRHEPPRRGSPRPARSSTAVTARSPAAAASRSATTTRSTTSRPRTSSSRSAPCRRCRRSRASTRSRTGRTATRRWRASCPRACVVLGGGPTGCELAQVYVRFDVPTTIVQSGPRLAPTDHPRNSEVAAGRAGTGRGDRADRRPGTARACGRGHGRRPRHRARRRLDGRGPRDPARGRTRLPARGPRPRALRHRHDRADAVPARRPAADRRRAVGHRRPGRPRAPHPPGALPGRDGRPDGARRDRSCPTTGRCRARPTPTPRRHRSVRRSTSAQDAGIDAFELVADYATSTKGYAIQAEIGHVTIVVDRRVARAGRCRDGLPRRVGGDPRVRRRDQGARAGRRPGRHDPRVPVDVAHLQRAVRRRAKRQLDGPTRPSARRRPGRRAGRSTGGRSRAPRRARPDRRWRPPG